MPDNGGLPEALLAQSPACHWIVDADQVFRAVFGDLVPLFGKPGPELIDRRVDEVLSPEFLTPWKSRFARSLGGETLSLRERNGGGTWNISVFPIRTGGSIGHCGGQAREVTSWNKAEQELRNTVLGALKAQEFERNMMSRFLHDSVGQNLTAFGLQLDLIRMDLEDVAPITCGRVGEIQKLLEGMMKEVRDYSYELNPSTVERVGLRSALDRLVARLKQRFTGTLRLNVDPSLKLDKKIATALYHIAQEAVENAVQHSSCSAIEIAVKSTRAGTFLEVRDNGRGFDPADLGEYRGLGLLSMEHYAAQAGLELSIQTTRETGTTVRAVTQGV